MTNEEYSRIEGGKVVGAAIDFMRMQPKNPDGTMGFMAPKHSPEWDMWQAYFVSNGMKSKASLMRTMQAFMVPCRDPRDFDPAYKPMIVEKTPLAAELTQAERDRLAARFKTMIPPKATRYQAPDAKAKDPFARRELSDAEKVSAKRLAGIVQQHRAAE